MFWHSCKGPHNISNLDPLFNLMRSWPKFLAIGTKKNLLGWILGKVIKKVKTKRRYVRVVKETDFKSVGLRPRRFQPCCRHLIFCPAVFFLFVPPWAQHAIYTRIFYSRFRNRSLETPSIYKQAIGNFKVGTWFIGFLHFQF